MRGLQAGLGQTRTMAAAKSGLTCVSTPVPHDQGCKETSLNRFKARQGSFEAHVQLQSLP